jgi:hypothetical protein
MDILGTVGVAWEVKTGIEWRAKWLRQALANTPPGELGVVAYLPPGCGEASVGDALAIMPLRTLMPLLVAAGYAPPPDSAGTR